MIIMRLGRFTNSSLLVKLMLWMGILIVFFFIFFIGSTVLLAKGINLNQPAIMRWILAYQDIFLFTVPALLATCLWSSQPAQWLHIRHHTDGKTILFAVLIMLVALPGNNLLAWLNSQISLPDCLAPLEQWMQQQEESSQRVLTTLLSDTRLDVFIANLLVIAILAAIGEEFCFRGVLQGLMQHTTKAIWLTAIIFSVIHFQFDGFFPRMLMGALFGYMLVWTDNLWIPVIMHCTNNAAVTTLYYIATVRNMDTQVMDAFGTEDTLWVGILSLVIVGIGIYFLRRSLTMSNASSRTSKGN